jgi:hypothetical protein
MITIFYTVVLSVIQGVALNTGVLPFSMGRALQNHRGWRRNLAPMARNRGNGKALAVHFVQLLLRQSRVGMEFVMDRVARQET